MASSEQIKPVVAIVGATATGKSDLAIRLAETLHGEVINADAMQFYCGMNIGTAKLSHEEQKDVPHHLLDIFTLNQEASVANFQALARQNIEQIRSRGRTPIITGGSGLYIRAALDELEFPPTDSGLREKLTRQAEIEGIDALRKRLVEIDPESAARIQDDRRIIRALEVHQLTGRRFSSFMPQRRYAAGLEPVTQIGISIPRQDLHERIALRVHRMVDEGFVDEVRQLMKQGLVESPTAGSAIGYRQMIDVVEQRSSLNAAIESTIVATRRFARRQETWFKADPRVHWLDGTLSAQQQSEFAVQIIQDSLNRVDTL